MPFLAQVSSPSWPWPPCVYRTNKPLPFNNDLSGAFLVDPSILAASFPPLGGTVDFLDPAQVPLCGSAADPITAVWGDSHAVSLFDGVVSRAEKYHLAYKFFVCWSTPPVLGLASTLKNNRHSEDVCEYLVHDPHIKNVILIANWTGYLEGQRFFGRKLGHEPQFSFHEVRVNQGNKYAIFEAQLRDTVVKLTSAGKRVFICTPIPVYSFNVPRGINEMERQGRPPNVALSHPLADYLAVNGRLLGIFQNLSESVPNTYVIPIHLDLFAGGRSVVEEGGHSLYQDGHHLDGRGSQRLGERVSQSLTAHGG